MASRARVVDRCSLLRAGQRRERKTRPRLRLGLELLEDRSMLNGLAPTTESCPRELTVMSRNLYLGADLAPAMGAVMSGDPIQIIAAVSQLWAGVQATNFPERAVALAGEIEAVQPALIGMQEVTLFRSGPVGDPAPAETVQLDYLQLLLNALEGRGLHYAPVVVTQEFDAELPGFLAPGVLQDMRLTDRDVILARTDLPSWQMSLSNVQEGHFVTNVQLPIGESGEVFTLLRGWNSVDVQLLGQDLRFLNAHVETPDNPLFEAVQIAQAAEVVAGPANTAMSVVLVGDYNSPAERPASQAYGILVGAGFTDAWNVTHPGEPGYTWGNEPDLQNDTPLVVDPQRIDLVLYRGDLAAREMDRVGEEPADQTPSGLWPSDHAGVAATLALHVAADGSELPWAVVNDDPQRPGERAVFVVGTQDRDRIVVDQHRNGEVFGRVARYGEFGPFQPTAAGHVYVCCGAGSDSVEITWRVSHDSVIDAGAGNDKVYAFSWVGNDIIDGGDGNDLLFGGRGNDTLSGGPGRDILFGQWGDDVLDGGLGRDFLFGGPGTDQLVDADQSDRALGRADRERLTASSLEEALLRAATQKTNDAAIVEALCERRSSQAVLNELAGRLDGHVADLALSGLSLRWSLGASHRLIGSRT